MYCLWLNGKKVYNLQQLMASFDAEAVQLYCLGGGLARWLKDCGEQAIAEKVEQIDISKNISRQLAEIFGVDLPEKEEAYEPAPTANAPALWEGSSFGISPASLPETSFFIGSFGSSFNLSNIYTSFFTTSFLTSSFTSGYEHEYEYESGSFTAASFSLYQSSFFANTAFFAGSFTFETNSFSLFSGSFASEYGSFLLEYGSFTPVSDSFRFTLSSFSPKSLETAQTATASAPEKDPTLLTPQQKFELNLSSCPLNRYGYGIHLV